MSGERHGYESVEFTSDGGFIAGGFVKRYGNMPGFKSGGSVDDGTAIFQKFSAEVAQATANFETPGLSFVGKETMVLSIVIATKEVQYHRCKFSWTTVSKKLSRSSPEVQ